MAYTKNPRENTYQNKQLELFAQQNNRGTNATKDEDYLNVFIEIIKNKATGDEDKYIVKRSGNFEAIPSVGGTVVRGWHYNEDFGKLYYCVTNNLYIYNLETGTAVTTLVTFFGTSSGDVGFTDYLYADGTTVVVATDGTTVKQITNAEVVTACTDPDLPTPHLPVPIFLDGYLFLVKSGTSDIYNSDLNDPLLWTAGNFISAEIAPDNLRTIAKLNNYIIAFGSASIEYFWDAANVTGSPLQRNDTPVKFNGYLGGLAQHGNKLYFLGNNISGQPEVFMLEDFKMEALATQSVIRYLAALSPELFSSIKGSIVCIQGHEFYLINTDTYTYVVDLDTKLWYRWAFSVITTFPMIFCINVKTTGAYIPYFVMEGSTAILKFDPNVYTDNGANFTASGTTDNHYFDSYNQKTMNNLVVWADKPPGAANIAISWSDNDYQTFSTPRNINLFQERPNLNMGGRFRRRAFKWSFTENSPFRLKAIAVDINLGTS